MTSADGTTGGSGHSRVRAPARTLVVLAVAAALLVLGWAAAQPLDLHTPFSTSVALPWWAWALAFVATEACVLNIQVRRQGQTVSLSELPLVLGFFFCAPLVLVAGRLIGSAAVYVLHRRAPALKTTFNLSLVVAETFVGLLLFSAVTSWAGTQPPGTWLAAYVAGLAANAVGVLAIGGVIAVYEGELDLRHLLREAAISQPAVPTAVTVALVAVSSLTASPHNAWLLLVVVALLLVGYRGYARLSERHTNLGRLYRFSQAVSGTPDLDAVLRSALQEARELLVADRAAVCFLVPGPAEVVRVELGPDGVLSRSGGATLGAPQHALLRHMVDGRGPLLLPRGARDTTSQRWLAGEAARDAVAVPLRGSSGALGVLLVADRMGDFRTFVEDDVRLLETVANHAGVALQNGQLMERLRHDALHDALTGLPNRVQLQRDLGTALADVAAQCSPGAAVMILDLDDFKDVNDSLGHQQGDLLLVEVAARLAAGVGSLGTVCRLGGDEFAVLVTGTADPGTVTDVAHGLLAALAQPVALDGLEVEVHGSVGVALAPEHATDAAALLKRADLAMYDAKVAGHGVRLYQPDLETHPRRLALAAELRAALHADTLDVFVQPKALLRSGEVVGVEALARWTHPTLGPIGPDEFIPVAERSGLIGLLTTRVLEASLAAQARWRAEGLDLGVAVNLSTRSLLDAGLVSEVGLLLERYGVPGDRLTLEVTESSVMADPVRAVALLHQLRDLGVQLSVDDFGTGYSSLSYLKRLPVHEVKIDRTFVAGLREDGEDLAIVRAIIDLGRHLGLDVVAEGVEDQATWDLLTTLGCDLVQGWHLAAAMRTGELPAWAATRTPPAVAGLGLPAI